MPYFIIHNCYFTLLNLGQACSCRFLFIHLYIPIYFYSSLYIALVTWVISIVQNIIVRCSEYLLIINWLQKVSPILVSLLYLNHYASRINECKLEIFLWYLYGWARALFLQAAAAGVIQFWHRFTLIFTNCVYWFTSMSKFNNSSCYTWRAIIHKRVFFQFNWSSY